ncbi:MAG: topoisomerase DNA-binding C4 zinc finger domain-containing protein [Acetomicrobium sp.]
MAVVRNILNAVICAGVFSRTKGWQENAYIGGIWRKAGFSTVETGIYLSALKSLSQRCPKSGIPMVLRKAVRGKNAGSEFYGCPNYPKCKEIINKETPKPILGEHNHTS